VSFLIENQNHNSSVCSVYDNLCCSSLILQRTNHLDLEAVLWLESYMQSYRHTLIVVSHDRSFLNEVCTDTIEFKNRTLTYYKGDYDTYVRTSEENVKNLMRVYQAYQDKR
jgi:ATP-binding cassette subfamily F protein 3